MQSYQNATKTVLETIHDFFPNTHSPNIIGHVNYLPSRIICTLTTLITSGFSVIYMGSLERQAAMTKHKSLTRTSTTEVTRGSLSQMISSRAHKCGQNLNIGISVFLIYENAIPVLISVLITVFQKQTFQINFEEN
jgi:hypothetical protein